MEIIKNNTTEAWKEALKFIMSEGNDFIDRDKRVCREVLNLTLKIIDLDDVEYPINIMNSYKDFIYPNKDELKDMILNKIHASGYEYCYGFRLFSYRHVKNQIDNFIYPLLKSDYSTRRAIAVLYDPLTDSDFSKNSVPALISVYFKINNSKLDLTVLIRSNDFFIGFPANLYQLKMLQDYLASKLKVNSGFMTIFSNSAHIFKEHFEKINNIIS